MIMVPADSIRTETMYFSANAEGSLKDDFVSSPIMAGFTAVFGKGGNIVLDRDWYSYLIDPADNLRITDMDAFSVDPFSFNEDKRNAIRKNITRLMSITDTFTVDREKLRGGERMQFAKLLISLNSIEIIGRAVKKNMTTTTDLKRALNYAVRNEITGSAIPYVIYLTKCI